MATAEEGRSQRRSSFTSMFSKPGTKISHNSTRSAIHNSTRSSMAEVVQKVMPTVRVVKQSKRPPDLLGRWVVVPVFLLIMCVLPFVGVGDYNNEETQLMYSGDDAGSVGTGTNLLGRLTLFWLNLPLTITYAAFGVWYFYKRQFKTKTGEHERGEQQQFSRSDTVNLAGMHGNNMGLSGGMGLGGAVVMDSSGYGNHQRYMDSSNSNRNSNGNTITTAPTGVIWEATTPIPTPTTTTIQALTEATTLPRPSQHQQQQTRGYCNASSSSNISGDGHGSGVVGRICKFGGGPGGCRFQPGVHGENAKEGIFNSSGSRCPLVHSVVDEHSQVQVWARPVWGPTKQGNEPLYEYAADSTHQP